MRLLSVALHVSAEPPALPRGRSLRRAPRGAGWSCGEAVRATARDAEQKKTDLENVVGVAASAATPLIERSEPTHFPRSPLGKEGASNRGGRGHWGSRPGIDLKRRSAGLARRMPASWRDDCHAVRAAACRRGTAGSSQRDSAAAGPDTTPHCAYLYSSAEEARKRGASARLRIK